MKRGIALVTVALAAAALAAPAAAAPTFSRTDYPFASWTGSPQASEVGSDENTNDAPLAIADVNGDGKPDIVMSDNHLNRISVLLNDGTGKFTKAPDSPISNCHAADSILVGDFTGDGKQDVLVDCSTEYSIELLPGDGAGGFASTASATLTGLGPMLRTQVLHNDDDVLYNVVNGSCYVPVVALKGSGNLDGQRSCPQPGVMTWGADVHWYDSTCATREFLSFSGSTPGQDYTATVLELGPDGANQCNDWATGDRDSGIVCCLAGPTAIGTADLDKDGSPDIVMTSASGFHTLSGWNQTTGVGTVPNNIPSTGAITDFAVADFDGDGNLDLAGVETFADYTHNVVAIHAGQGSVSQFGAPQPVDVFGDQQNYSDAPRIAVADLNGDGKPDIVTTASGGNAGINSTAWTDDVTVLLNGTVPSTSGGGTGGGGNQQQSPVGGAGPTPTGVFAGLKIHPQTLTVKNGAVHVTGTCPPGALIQCVGTDTLTTIKAVSVRVERRRKAIVKLGSTRFTIPAGSTKSLTIKLTKPALKLLAKSKSLRARETVKAHDGSGISKTTSATVTLKRAKKR